MPPQIELEHLRYITSTTASLFGLYGIVVALLLQIQREGKFIGRRSRVAVSGPILLLAFGLIMGIVVIAHSWANSLEPSSLVVRTIVTIDTIAISWIAVTLICLIFRIGKS